MQVKAVPADRRCQPDAPQWSGAPLPAISGAFRAAIGKAFSHVVQEQVRKGPDLLVREMRLAGHRPGRKARAVAGRAAAFMEQAFSGQNVRVGSTAPAGHGQVLGIKGDTVDDLCVGFHTAMFGIAVRGSKAVRLSWRTVT